MRFETLLFDSPAIQQKSIFTLLDKASPIVLYFHLFGISQSKRSKRISREQINQHTVFEPFIRFNLMNQHFWGKNIKIYHKNATTTIVTSSISQKFNTLVPIYYKQKYM